MKNGFRIQKIIRTTDMVSFLERAGYTTKSVSQILGDLGINEHLMCWPLGLSTCDLSYKISWNNERDRNKVYSYLGLFKDLSEPEREKIRQNMLYLSTYSRFNGLYRSNLTDTQLTQFLSQVIAENLMISRINEIITEGDV